MNLLKDIKFLLKDMKNCQTLVSQGLFISRVADNKRNLVRLNEPQVCSTAPIQ